jgi:hypothetical protein
VVAPVTFRALKASPIRKRYSHLELLIYGSQQRCRQTQHSSAHAQLAHACGHLANYLTLSSNLSSSCMLVDRASPAVVLAKHIWWRSDREHLRTCRVARRRVGTVGSSNCCRRGMYDGSAREQRRGDRNRGAVAYIRRHWRIFRSAPETNLPAFANGIETSGQRSAPPVHGRQVCGETMLFVSNLRFRRILHILRRIGNSFTCRPAPKAVPRKRQVGCWTRSPEHLAASMTDVANNQLAADIRRKLTLVTKPQRARRPQNPTLPRKSALAA